MLMNALPPLATCWQPSWTPRAIPLGPPPASAEPAAWADAIAALLHIAQQTDTPATPAAIRELAATLSLAEATLIRAQQLGLWSLSWHLLYAFSPRWITRVHGLRLLFGRAALMLDRDDEATRHLTPLSQMNVSPHALLATAYLAQLDYKHLRWARGVARCQKMLDRPALPSRPEVYTLHRVLLRGLVGSSSPDYLDAAQRAAQAAADTDALNDSDRLQFLLEYAYALGNTGHYARAIDTLTELTHRYADHPHRWELGLIFGRIAMVHFLYQQPALAEQATRREIELMALDAPQQTRDVAALNAAYILAYNGQLDEALLLTADAARYEPIRALCGCWTEFIHALAALAADDHDLASASFHAVLTTHRAHIAPPMWAGMLHHILPHALDHLNLELIALLPLDTPIPHIPLFAALPAQLQDARALLIPGIAAHTATHPQAARWLAAREAALLLVHPAPTFPPTTSPRANAELALWRAWLAQSPPLDAPPADEAPLLYTLRALLSPDDYADLLTSWCLVPDAAIPLAIARWTNILRHHAALPTPPRCLPELTHALTLVRAWRQDRRILLDPERGLIFSGQHTLQLSPRTLPLRMLRALATHPDGLTRRALYEAVWELKYLGRTTDSTLATTISQLRRTLRDAGLSDDLITHDERRYALHPDVLLM
jgi:hypothetical protein